jgi:hypothetical protein
MTIGTSIILIVLGAILAFGLTIDLPGVNDDVIGYVLMGAGAIGLVIGLILMSQRSRPRRASTTSVTQDAYGNETVRRTDQHLDPPPGPAPL